MMIKIDQNDLRIRSEIINDYFYHASVFDDSKLIDTSVYGVFLLLNYFASFALSFKVFTVGRVMDQSATVDLI